MHLGLEATAEDTFGNKRSFRQSTPILFMPLSFMLLFAVLGAKPRAFRILGKNPLLRPAVDDVKSFFRGKADVT